MKKVYFIGIGGIGMSALARWYKAEGWEVSGSDNGYSDVIKGLEEEDVKVNILDKDNLENKIPEGISKIIYTIAIPENHPELAFGRGLEKNQVPVLTYPQALGEMTMGKNVIAVCGTHGKTTTTAITYEALKSAGVKVSMIVGSLIDVDGKKTNFINGGQEGWVVIEACEYRRSFLNYNPKIVLVTNIDNDHLDYFKDVNDIKNAFQEFVNKTSDVVIVHKEESFLEVKENTIKIICEDIISDNEITLSVPGRHNRKNAQLVVALGEYLKLDREKVLQGLKNFKGTWRRQEYKGNFLGAEFYDDYAHHPSETRATLQAFREKFPEKKIIAIFQPHLYSRTKILFNDFVSAFTDADKVFLLPIYAAREKFDDTISSEMLATEIGKSKPCVCVSGENVIETLKQENLENSVVITMGAGDIYGIYKNL
jgi:UDP-N-acetylmuramate--alanine ligase